MILYRVEKKHWLASRSFFFPFQTPFLPSLLNLAEPIPSQALHGAPRGAWQGASVHLVHSQHGRIYPRNYHLTPPGCHVLVCHRTADSACRSPVSQRHAEKTSPRRHHVRIDASTAPRPPVAGARRRLPAGPRRRATAGTTARRSCCIRRLHAVSNRLSNSSDGSKG